MEVFMNYRSSFFIRTFLLGSLLFISSFASAQSADELVEMKAKIKGVEIFFRFYNDLPKAYVNTMTRGMESLDTEIVKKIHDTRSVILFALNEQDFKTMYYDDETPRNVRVIKVNLKNSPRWDAIKVAITASVNQMN